MEKKLFEYELESFHLEQNHNGTKHDLVVLVKDYSPHGQDQEFRFGCAPTLHLQIARKIFEELELDPVDQTLVTLRRIEKLLEKLVGLHSSEQAK